MFILMKKSGHVLYGESFNALICELVKSAANVIGLDLNI